MTYFINLIGKRFGRLEVIKREDNDRGGHTRWLCKCDCGNEKIIYGVSLRKGHTISCGCWQRESRYLPFEEASKNALYKRYKDNAKNRNILFELSKEEFLKLAKENCFYCGKKPSNIFKNIHNNGNYIYNGIDRINSFDGYVKDNVVSCCSRCNHAKSDGDIKDFLEWIDRVYEYRHQESLDKT